MSEAILAPKLRFPEFSREWKKEKFDSLYTRVRNGFVGTATPYYVDEGVPYLQGRNIKNGAINKKGLIYINNYFHQKNKKSQLQLNDIVMVQSGHVGECALIAEEYINSNCHALLVLTPTDRVFSKFYVYYFYSEFGRKCIHKITIGNTIKHILSSDLKIQAVFNPTLPEQQKIATFLTSVDTKIEQLSKKQELLSNYKKGLMQKIFSQEIRFKADDGSGYPDWETRKLGDCSCIKKGSQLNRANLNEIGNYPAINGGINPSGYTDDWNTKENTITISEGGNSCGYVNLITTKFWSGGHCYSVKELEDDVLNIFLFQNLKHNQSSIKKLRVGSGLPNIQKGDITNLEIKIPNLEEQTKIANFLSSIDSKIEQIVKQLDETKQFKKALLQQMFV